MANTDAKQWQLPVDILTSGVEGSVFENKNSEHHKINDFTRGRKTCQIVDKILVYKLAINKWQQNCEKMANENL